MATSPTRRTGPVVIAYDGSEAAGHAVREAGELLAGQPALVVAIWKQGLGFELLEIPSASLGVPPAQVEVRAPEEIDDEMQERALHLAQQGAVLARHAGFAAEGLAVADQVDMPVGDAILQVAQDRDARAIVIGAHSQGEAAEIILGSTTRTVVRHATCPVVVVRERVTRARA